MKLDNPVRLGGLAALLAGVLLFISQLVDLFSDFLPFKLSGNELAIYGFGGIDTYLGILLIALLQLGLVGLYVPQAKATRALGLAGFLLAFIGGRFVLDPSFVDPIRKASISRSGGGLEEFWWSLVLFALVFAVGWALFGIAMLRAGTYPRTANTLLVVGTLILFFPLPLSGSIFAVAMAWMGYALFAGGSEPTPQRTPDNPVRLGGLAALLAGVLLIISEVLGLYLSLFPVLYGRYFALEGWAGIDRYLGLLLPALVQLGLVGLYAPQVRFTGALGLVGFLLAFIGVWATVGGSFIAPIYRPEWLADEELLEAEFWVPLAVFVLTFVVGWVLFGVATLRARIYPRAAATLLVVGTLIFLLPLPLSGVIFAVAVAWMGYILFKGEEAPRPTSA